MKIQILKYAYLIAAALVLAGVAFSLLSNPGKPKTVESELFQPEKDNLENILAKIKVFGFAGEPQTRDDSLAAALDLYGSAQYPAAQKSLLAYLAAYPDDLTARFYFGMTHLYMQAPEKAFDILSPLSDLPGFDMQDDARWYAALAAANVDKMRATGLFSRLSNDPTSKYRQAASAVISTITENPDHFTFHIESGDVLKCSLVVAARSAWWQAGWVRTLVALLFPAGGVSMVFWRRRINQLEKENAAIGQEKARSEALLHNILPTETAEELKKYGHSETRRFEEVTVLFCDFMDFTKISEMLQPEVLVANLNVCFEAFDHIVEAQTLEKIKTVGDCYICAAGLKTDSKRSAEDNANLVVRTAQQMLTFLSSFNEEQVAAGKPRFEARIGIHTGTVVAGIVGIKKYAYDIWGDTVNIAARMEQSSEGGRINISGYTYELVKNHFPCLYRGKVDAKGKGAVDMYFVG
jgi:class 3 adenylate cyclase